jgi:hypothetical protein
MINLLEFDFVCYSIHMLLDLALPTHIATLMESDLSVSDLVFLRLCCSGSAHSQLPVDSAPAESFHSVSCVPGPVSLSARSFVFFSLLSRPSSRLWISFRARSSRSARAESSGTVCARGVALFCLESGTIAASSLLKQCSRAVLFFIALSSLILFVLWLDCCRNLFRSYFWATRLKRSMFSSFNYSQTVVFWTRPQWVWRNAYENMNWVLVWFFIYSLTRVLTSIDSCFCCGS